jgi:hypothetical protein
MSDEDEMTGGRHRQELGESLDDPEDDDDPEHVPPPFHHAGDSN